VGEVTGVQTLAVRPKRPRSRSVKVYSMFDGEPGVHAIVRYSGDPDEFTALAHAWLAENIEHSVFFDYPVAVVAPELRWFRMNPYSGDDYGWSLGFPTGPGRGNWLGSYLKVVKIGCSECKYLHGAHHPGGCLNTGIVGFQTCQMSLPGARKSNEVIHLVRVRGRAPGRLGGTPGPTMCGVDRHGPDVGFVMGGGTVGPDMRIRACYQCVHQAKREFPGLPVSTSFREFAQAYVDAGMTMGGTWKGRLTPTPGSPGDWAVRGLVTV
jgi:hypothetical protein